MAYPIRSATRECLAQDAYQTVQMTVHPLEGDTITITNTDVVSGTLSVDRYSVSGSSLELGSVIASELKFTLYNRDDRFSDVNFGGAEIVFKIGVLNATGAVCEYIPMGVFTVDSQPRKTSRIDITALDRMAQLSRITNLNSVVYPITVSTMINKLADACDITVATNVNALPNATYQINGAPAMDRNDYTWRSVLSWCCEILGCCAFFDWDGKLQITFYSSESCDTVDPTKRFSGDVHTDGIQYTGVQIFDVNNVGRLYGSEGYIFNIQSNPFITHDTDLIGALILSKIASLGKYYRYDCTVCSMPYIWPMDCITYVTKSGTSYKTVVTHANHKANGRTVLKAVGVSTTAKEFARRDLLTAHEKAIIANMNEQTRKNISNSQQATIELNSAIGSAMGLYFIEVPDSIGGTKYYYCNANTLEDSTVIYTMNENGFAWSTSWNGGHPIWNYGITKDGNAVLNYLTLNRLTATQIDATDIQVQSINVLGQITASSLYLSRIVPVTIWAKTAKLPKFGMYRIKVVDDSEGIEVNVVYDGTENHNSFTLVLKHCTVEYNPSTHKWDVDVTQGTMRLYVYGEVMVSSDGIVSVSNITNNISASYGDLEQIDYIVSYKPLFYFSDNEEPVVVDIRINGTTLHAVDGSTWGDWLMSEYVPGGWTADSSGYLHDENGHLLVIGGSNTPVYVGDGIDPNVSYITADLITFKVRDDDYVATRGSTFEQWMQTDYSYDDYGADSSGWIFKRDGNGEYIMDQNYNIVLSGATIIDKYVYRLESSG